MTSRPTKITEIWQNISMTNWFTSSVPQAWKPSILTGFNQWLLPIQRKSMHALDSIPQSQKNGWCGEPYWQYFRWSCSQSGPFNWNTQFGLFLFICSFSLSVSFSSGLLFTSFASYLDSTFGSCPIFWANRDFWTASGPLFCMKGGKKTFTIH